jgi:peptidoglycan/xylan/chitin deacetylase (PgdA/CDA1 family)
MQKWLAVTIDTEGDRACPFFGNRWGPLTQTFHSVVDGIPRLRSIWDKLCVMPVYLTTPEVLSSPDSVDVLKQEQRAGAEIGTHLHIGTEFPCNVPDEYQHLERVTSLYEQALGSAPRSYRAGRYGANDRTLATLQRLGYTVDTSVTPYVNWSPQGGPDYTTHPIKPYWVGDVLEVPVTILGPRAWWPFNGWSRYRWLRPSTATVEQLRRIVDDAADRGLEVLNMMFHTMELIPGASPYVRTSVGAQLYLRRLETAIAYALRRGFEPITLSGLHTVWGCQRLRARERAAMVVS